MGWAKLTPIGKIGKNFSFFEKKITKRGRRNFRTSHQNRFVVFLWYFLPKSHVEIQLILALGGHIDPLPNRHFLLPRMTNLTWKSMYTQFLDDIDRFWRDLKYLGKYTHLHIHEHWQSRWNFQARDL